MFAGVKFHPFALVDQHAAIDLAAGQIQGGATPATALCIGTAVVSELTLAELRWLFSGRVKSRRWTWSSSATFIKIIMDG